LSSATLHKAKLPYSVMARANLTEADMRDAILTQTDLHRINDEKTKWQGANLRDARVKDKELAKAEQWTYAAHIMR
jgi:uncharacterized protein YjbI with pentapeptide repeats